MERIGWPGEYPFTRGIHPTGYRGKPWTIRQFAGFGNAKQTNERYKMILAEGGGGLSVAFDMPTLMGRDSDDERALGEVGHCGVAIDSAADMEILFDGIDLATTTTSMTISGPAVPIFCMYVVAAERQGADPAKLNGTLQTDIFKEYIAQKEWVYPPEPHLKLIGDLMEYVNAEVPAYKPVSVSGYHIREAGATAAQELAFTLADGFGYVELGLSRGLDVDSFASGLSFFFDAHLDFFEEIAKLRAARRIWARWMRDVYGAKTDKAQWLRFHTQTAGVSLTAQQPDNNIVRTAIEALAAVLGGTNSLHTNALDEVLALPSDKSAQIALRTQQVIGEEIGVLNVADPLGGSWYVEALTDKIEAEAERIFERIKDMGGDGTMTSGLLRGIEDGWFIGEIADSSFAYQVAMEKGDKKVVGVNTLTGDVGDAAGDHARLARGRTGAERAARVPAGVARPGRGRRSAGAHGRGGRAGSQHAARDARRGARRGDAGRDLLGVQAALGRLQGAGPLLILRVVRVSAGIPPRAQLAVVKLSAPRRCHRRPRADNSDQANVPWRPSPPAKRCAPATPTSRSEARPCRNSCASASRSASPSAS